MVARIIRYGKLALKKIRQIYINVLIKRLELTGFEVFKKDSEKHYVLNYFGRSSHKQINIRTLPIFGELADLVIQDRRTTLYYDRLFTIYQIIEYLKNSKHDGRLQMAEIGVYKGGTSYFIATAAQKLGLLYTHSCFDTFEGHPKSDINRSIETTHVAGSFRDTSYEAVSEYLSIFKDVKVYKGRFQDTCQVLEDEILQFAYLDMDIYEPTIFALNYLNNKIIKGGVILLDDYGFASCPGIEKAVKEFTQVNGNYFGISLLSGQYILIKL